MGGPRRRAALTLPAPATIVPPVNEPPAARWQTRILAGVLAPLLALAGCATREDPLLDLLREHGVVSQPAPAGHGSAAGAELVLAAMNFLDTRYRLGGNSAAEGFDCSGFTRHVYATALGIALPRRSAEQARQAGWHDVPPHQLQPGDLVFFNTMRRAFSHVGIYVGEGKFIHSPKPGAQVRVEDMGQNYWQRRFDGARRVLSLAPAEPGPAARQATLP